MSLRLTFLAVVVGASCACTSVKPQRPAPTLGDDIPQCYEHMLSRVAPKYPAQAMQNNIMGWVVLAYDLDGSGKAKNIRKVDSEPDDTFVQSGAAAIDATHFKAGLVQSDCTAMYTYELEAFP